MIEDKKIGLKMTESEEETLWENVKKQAQEEMKQNKRAILLNQKLFKLAETEISNLTRGKKKSLKPKAISALDQGGKSEKAQ